MCTAPKSVVSLFIPLYGAMAINKTLEMIRAAHPEAKFVDFIFDNDEGLIVASGTVETRIEKASFETFDFSVSAYEDDDDEDMEADSQDEGVIIYSMNQEMRTISNQFRVATLRDSLRIELLQSADSHAPDIIKFVINETREFCNPTTQIDQIRTLRPEADITLARNVDTSKLNAAHSSFRDSRMRRVLIASRKNPHNKKSSLAIQALDGAPRAGAYTNVYYIDGAEDLEDPVEFAVDLKSTTLLKQLAIMSSSATLSVDADDDPETARHFVLCGTLPRGFRPVTVPIESVEEADASEDNAKPPKSKKKRSTQPAIKKIGEVVIRIPCSFD